MMARTFNGTSDYGSVALNLSAYSQLSISLWWYWDSFANNDDLLLEYTPDFNTNNGFVIDPNGSGGTVIIKQSQNGVGFNGGSFARPTGATWHHGLFTFDRNGGTATQETVFIDSVSQTISQASSAPVAGNFDNSTLFLMSRNGGSLFGAGRIADLALWGGVLLTASDATALFATVVFPQEIYRDNLVGYWPMCGAENPEPDQSRTNADMTMTGTTRSRHLRDNPYCFFPATMIPLSALE